MAHEIIAGVISKHAFVSPTSLKFSGYIAYMSRSEAVRTESYASHNFAFDDMDFDGYNNYMSNPEKSSGLFSKDGNFLTKSQVKNLQKQFAVAQNNESNMMRTKTGTDKNIRLAIFQSMKNNMIKEPINWIIPEIKLGSCSETISFMTVVALTRCDTVSVDLWLSKKLIGRYSRWSQIFSRNFFTVYSPTYLRT